MFNVAIRVLFLFFLVHASLAQAEVSLPAVPNQYLIKYKTNHRVSRSSIRNDLGVRRIKSSSLSGTELIESKSSDSFDHEYAKNLIASGLVEYIEPNYIYSVNAVPNDSMFSELWGLHNTGQSGGRADTDIDAPEAWELSTGSEEIIVGVVDTGIDYNHPDLRDNIWVNPNEIPNNGIDDDNNGVIDDIHGYNAIDETGDPLDDHLHGTHCAGTIGALGNDGRGVSGVNWNVKLIGLKFLNSAGSGNTQDAIDAITYAVNLKRAGVNIRVLSNSWGGGSYSQALVDAISAANDVGILFVAAAGNSANDNDALASYPANYDVPNVLSVAALDHNGNLASFSNYGLVSVDVAAPGVNILSTVLNGGYRSLSGTSMATPHVSGIAALLLSHDSSLSTLQLKTRILTTVKPLDTLNGQLQYPGIVSAARALTNTRANLPTPERLIGYQSKSVALNFDEEFGTKVLQQDDGYVAQDLGFSFRYYGEDYSRIAISANGRVIPLAEDDDLPRTPDYSNAISRGIHIYNDDLFPSPSTFGHDLGGVWFKSSATEVTVTWIVVSYAQRNTSDSSAEARFQLKLFADGKIEFHYLDTDMATTTYSYGASASIGVAPINGVSGSKHTISHNESNEQQLGNNTALEIIKEQTKIRADFDGDAKSDIVVWRPSSAMWFILTSGSGFSYDEHLSFQLGLPGDIALLGDFDGDGKADPCVWRPSNGTWYMRLSADRYTNIIAHQWGLPGDRPVPGDFDGDDRTDLAVYRRGMFYTLLSSSNFNRDAALRNSGSAIESVRLGTESHYPITADFNGNGRDNYATVSPLLRFWSVKDLFSLPWGQAGDSPIACDWDGDSIADRVVVRVNSNNTLDWYAATSSGSVFTANFGSLGDTPNCDHDYDGDGQGDLSVFRRHSGEWFIKYSSTGETKAIPFGLPGDSSL